jgi:DNA repair protein RadC
MRNRVRMKDLPLLGRPREKMVSGSPKNLTEAELLAILLGTGTTGKNVIALSESLLKKYPGKKISQVSFDELIKISGVGKSKASRILSAFELGERFFAPSALTKSIIRSVDDVLQQVRDIADKRQEYLLVLYLNARHELLQKEVVGMGTINNLRLTPREIFSPAFQTPCASLIIVHNHPSGDPTPSDDDIRFTTRIHEAGELMGIPMVDHVIVAKSGYFSFRDNKMS